MAKSKKVSHETIERVIEDNVLRQGQQILVRDLRPGDEMVVAWDRAGRILKTTPVKTVTECEGMWRTHVHVNRNACHDTRTFVWVK